MKRSGQPQICYGFLKRDFPAHGHLVWELHVATGGNAVFSQDGLELPMSVGDVVISGPESSHALFVRDYFSFYYIRLDPLPEDLGRLGELRSLQAGQRQLRVHSAGLDFLASVRRKIKSANPSLRFAGELQFRAWLYELGTELLPDGGVATVGPAGETDRIPEENTDGIERTLQYMREHLDRRLSLDNLAALAGMDRFHYCRRFRQRLGLPPLAWFQAARIEAASFLLADSTIPLAEIARRFAFADQYHFSKAFRKHVGQAPGQFRAGL